MREDFRRAVAVGSVVWAIAAAPAAAQITTGSVFGSVKDAQGGVVPGATVTLVKSSSECSRRSGWTVRCGSRRPACRGAAGSRTRRRT